MAALQLGVKGFFSLCLLTAEAQRPETFTSILSAPHKIFSTKAGVCLVGRLSLRMVSSVSFSQSRQRPRSLRVPKRTGGIGLAALWLSILPTSVPVVVTITSLTTALRPGCFYLN